MSAKIQPQMLPETVTYYDYEISKYPDRIRVCFEDGKSFIYELKCTQPHPVIAENIQIIRRMKQGYINQPARRKHG